MVRGSGEGTFRCRTRTALNHSSQQTWRGRPHWKGSGTRTKALSEPCAVSLWTISTANEPANIRHFNHGTISLAGLSALFDDLDPSFEFGVPTFPS